MRPIPSVGAPAPVEWRGILVDAETAAKLEMTPAYRELGMRNYDTMTDDERDRMGPVEFQNMAIRGI